MTLKVIVGIHWEALKMWVKGVRYLGRGGAPVETPQRVAPERKAAA
jgi:DUF1365 family protein